MRKVNCTDPQLNYINRRLNSRKPSFIENLRYSHSTPTPGNIMHDHPRSKYVFARRVGLGQKVNLLYWRLHPSEVYFR